MAESKTTLKPGDKLPPRGRSFKTLLLEVLREESMIGLGADSTKEEAAKSFIKHIAKRAISEGDPNSAMLLKELLVRTYPGLKSTLDKFIFDFPESGTDVSKSNAILKAVSDGNLPPDVGQLLVGIIKDGSIIEANTDLKERIEKLEVLFKS